MENKIDVNAELVKSVLSCINRIDTLEHKLDDILNRLDTLEKDLNELDNTEDTVERIVQRELNDLDLDSKIRETAYDIVVDEISNLPDTLDKYDVKEIAEELIDNIDFEDIVKNVIRNFL